MKPISFVLVFLFTAAVSAQSRPNKIDLDQEKCLSVKHGTMPRAQCYSVAFEAWEKDVSETYASLRPRLSVTQAKALEASQNEWEKYRDSEFEFISALYSKKKAPAISPPASFRE